MLVDVQFESLTGGALELYAILDPGLSNSGDDDRARTQGATLAAYDSRYASALAASPAPSQVSSGYQGASDGWTDLRSDHRMDWAYDTASAAGNVVQTGAAAADRPRLQAPRHALARLRRRPGRRRLDRDGIARRRVRERRRPLRRGLARLPRRPLAGPPPPRAASASTTSR